MHAKRIEDIEDIFLKNRAKRYQELEYFGAETHTAKGAHAWLIEGRAWNWGWGSHTKLAATITTRYRAMDGWMVHDIASKRLERGHLLNQSGKKNRHWTGRGGEPGQWTRTSEGFSREGTFGT